MVRHSQQFEHLESKCCKRFSRKKIYFYFSTPEYELYDKEEGQVPEIGALHLVNEEDEVFLHKPSSHTTEDLFTIIHR